MSNPDRRHDLGDRAEDVFARFHTGRVEDLHPEDRAEAEGFWEFLGGLERPDVETTPSPLRWRRPVMVMGLLAALAACLLLVIKLPGTSLPWADQHSHEIFASGQAERRTIELADGSVVKLAATSKIDVSFSRTERRIQLLAGEALFNVAHNRDWPFIVQAGNGEVKAVGTAFDVKLDAASARVTVVEGVIRVSVRPSGGDRSGQTALVHTARIGDRLSFGTRRENGAPSAFITSEARVDVSMATAWTRGVLYFNGEPLRQVIETVNRYSREQVVLIDERQAELPIFGMLNEGDATALRDLIDKPGVVRVQ